MRCALETEWQQVEQVRIVSKALPTTKKTFRNNPKEKCQATNKETTCKDRNTQDSRRRNKIIESNASSYFTGLRVGESGSNEKRKSTESLYPLSLEKTLKNVMLSVHSLSGIIRQKKYLTWHQVEDGVSKI